MNTKSDFKFLTQTMDEMRESESARRASLEYRISSLENEQSVLRRYHSAEMENLRNELSQVNMERDRIFQALKESEKNKEVLLQASTRDLSVGGDTDLHAELARLRIERAQLLSAAAEEASRNERRLRETRAAAKSSADADIILERELRVSAEKSLESAKAEIGELRAEAGKGGLTDGAPSNEQLDAMQNDLARFKIETETLADECEALRGQLEEASRDYSFKIERLTEECRQAKARASHLERNGRYEAEGRAEVARLLQASHTNSIERSVVVSENPADDDREGDVAVVKLYDLLKKQTQATEEERLVYRELLAEHDDLLALLAQQDLLKESLKDSLTRKGGRTAVDAAIQEAEEKAKSKYGKYVRLA